MRGLAVLLFMLPLMAWAGDREVLVVGARSGNRGIPKEEILELLFLKAPCELPVAGAETMHRAWTMPGIVGCWYETISGEYAFISETFSRLGVGGPLRSVPHGVLHEDGSATITEPGYFRGWEGVQQVYWAQEQMRANSARREP